MTWQRFHNLEVQDDGATLAILDRIAERQKYFQATAAEKALETEPYRLTQKALDDVCNRVETRLAALMNNLQMFPLRTTRSIKDVKNGTCSTYVHFEKDELKGLPFRLTIALSLKFLDENLGSPIFKIAAAAALSEHEAADEEMQPFRDFQTCELQTFLDGPGLQNIFIEVLESAYTSIETGIAPPSGEALRIAINEAAA